MLFAAGVASTSSYLITEAKFVGLANWEQAATGDPLIFQALRLTTLCALIAVPLNVAIGVGLAMLLNTGVRGMRLYRTAFFMPSVLSGVAVALLWKWIFSGQYGLANYFLDLVGLPGPKWLADEAWALPSLVIMALWAIGRGIVIYLAGLQGINSDFYEAAQVDGAGWWTRLRQITLPLMSPALFCQLVTVAEAIKEKGDAAFKS